MAPMSHPHEALVRPLGPGEPVRYWQLDAVAEERYDVADVPMSGDMDPFFFLTRHKNFIPHEYPCRTAFRTTHRGHRPQVRGAFLPERWWLPFGSPRVDLSGFWFRPTRIAAWAQTQLETETEGIAQVRLSTCGGAVIWLNGAEIGWMAEYGRNLEASREFALPLQAGSNTVTVFFDDLAERDARFYFELDYLSGPQVGVRLPVPVAGETADAVEAALDGMHFDRPTYLDGEVALVLPQPLPMDAEVSVVMAGDFISAERQDRTFPLSAGKTRIVVGAARDLPAGFRHVDVTLAIGDFAASRGLGIEICHVERQGPSPATLPERIAEVLTEAAHFGDRDAVSAFARLAIREGGEETDAIIAAVLPAIEDCHDCADFALVPLLWARFAWGREIGARVRDRLDKAILAYRYWMDEPGNDVQWYFSENHALLFHTAAYLAGRLFPKSVFKRSGRRGAEQSATGADRLRAWFDHFEAWEMAEYNSAPYFPIDLKGLAALAALAPDADIAQRARRGIERLCEIVARSSHHGVLTAAQGRSYEHSLCPARTLELSGLARLLWGKGWYGRPMHALPLLALCLRDHGLELPSHLAAIADHTGDTHVEWRFAQGENRFAALYHYKGRHFAMGSAVRYRWGEWGYQETVLTLRLGERPEAAIWINHPGEVIQFGYARPSYWGGSGTLPRVHQYRGLAVLAFDVHEGQPDFTHAWFPRWAFDDSRIMETLALARCGDGGVLIRAGTSFQSIDTGPSAGLELRQPGLRTRWLVRVAETDDLDDLVHRFGRLAINEEADGSIRIEDPEYGPVVFSLDGTVSAQGRRLAVADYTVEGVTESFAGADLQAAAAAKARKKA